METKEQAVSDKLMELIDKLLPSSNGPGSKDFILALLRLLDASIIAESRSTEESDEWLEQVKNDTLLKINKRLRGNLVSENSHMIKSKVRKVFSVSNPLLLSLLERKVKKMLDLFEQQANLKREKIELEMTKIIRNRETVSSIDERKVHGRVVEKEQILEMLLDQSCTHYVGIIPIVGIGGIGKTTLAQFVFNDERVRNHFERRIWVYVSIKFELKNVLQNMLLCATGNVYDNITSIEGLRQKLSYELSDKRFLIVLDDAWSDGDDDDSWEIILHMLELGRPGSKVILTTRSKMLGERIGNTKTVLLNTLSEEDCLSIFESQAFKTEGEAEANPRFMAIGKEIVKKCNGMPFAAKALGVEARMRRDVDYWESMSDKNIEQLLESKDKLRKIELLTKKQEAVSYWRQGNKLLQEMKIPTIPSFPFALQYGMEL